MQGGKEEDLLGASERVPPSRLPGMSARGLVKTPHAHSVRLQQHRNTSWGAEEHPHPRLLRLAVQPGAEVLRVRASARPASSPCWPEEAQAWLPTSRPGVGQRGGGTCLQALLWSSWIRHMLTLRESSVEEA